MISPRFSPPLARRGLATSALFFALLLLAGACGAPVIQIDQGPRGTVRFQCEPPTATLEIDENRLGPVGMFQEEGKGILLRPGTHRIVVRAGGFFVHYETIELQENQTLLLEIALKPVPE